MKHIIHLTISDCQNERRIFNQAFSAIQWGYSVQIIALHFPGIPVKENIHGVPIERLPIPHFEKGPLKFLEFNLKAFKYLLTNPPDIIHAHDLWVLPAAAMASFIHKRPLVYDAHEYYRDLLIFRRKRLSGWIWNMVEKLLIKQVHTLIAINSHQEKLYQKAYPGIKSMFLLNVPQKSEDALPGFQEREKIILYQGLFRPGRGLEYLLPALANTPVGELWLIGGGELEAFLKHQVKTLGLQSRVRFLGFLPYDQILNLTARARVGVALFSGKHLNYRYAAPNKFFEYIQAGTPVIATRIPSFQEFLQEYEVGDLIDEFQLPDKLPALFEHYLLKEDYWQNKHQQCVKAREKWNWEIESLKLKVLYRTVLKGK